MPTSNQQPNPAAGMTLPAAVILTGTYPVFIEVTCSVAPNGRGSDQRSLAPGTLSWRSAPAE